MGWVLRLADCLNVLTIINWSHVVSCCHLPTGEQMSQNKQCCWRENVTVRWDAKGTQSHFSGDLSLPKHLFWKIWWCPTQLERGTVKVCMPQSIRCGCITKGKYTEKSTFSTVPSHRTRGNRQNLVHRNLHMMVRMNFLLCRSKQWTGCPERVGSLPHWRHSRTVWMQFCALGWPCLRRKVGPDAPTGVPSKLSHSVIVSQTWLQV